MLNTSNSASINKTYSIKKLLIETRGGSWAVAVNEHATGRGVYLKT
jgi:hypothetical protein